ncbi:MAG: hypothetical protein ACRYGG_12205 [Janthinobacterium lividum]
MKACKPDQVTIGKLVVRVMNDGQMNRFEASNFVASMFSDCTAIEALYCYHELPQGEKDAVK